MRLMTLTAQRVRMAGFPPDAPQCAYDVHAHETQLTARQLADCRYFVLRHEGGKFERYVLLYEAFLPEGFEAVAPGAERSRIFTEAQRKARAARQICLESLFPETRHREIGALWHPTPPQYAFDHTARHRIDADLL